MSGGGLDELKKPIYEGIVKPHSKLGAEFSRGIGWDYGLEESKKGQENPGRQVGKAAGYAAGYMLGSYLSGGLAGGAGGAAGGAGATAGAGTAASAAGAAGMGPEIAAGLLSHIPEAAVQGGVSGGSGLLSSGLANSAYQSMVPGVGTQQAQMLAAQTAEFGPYGLGKTMSSASGAQGLSPMQSMGGKYGGNMMSNLAGEKGQNLALKAGANMLQPPQQQPQQQSRPFQQAPQEPLPTPYGNASANAMPPGMTYEQWLKLKQQGLI